MATTIVYGNGREAWESGSYHAFRSGITNPPTTSDFGKVLIVDNGGFSGGFGFGSGINGELKSGLDSFVEGIKTPQDLQALAKGGLLYDIAYQLFSPESGANGVSEIAIVKAATTVAAKISIELTNGTIIINPLDEGLVGNGELNSDDMLVKGFGVKMTAHPTETGKYVFGFFVGKWKGLDGAGHEIGTPKEELVDAQYICESVPVGTIEELESWMKSDFAFQSMFVWKSTTGDGGDIIEDDLTGWGTGTSDFLIASGGTETFDDDDLDDAISKFNDVSFMMIMSDQYGSNATGSKNTRLQYYLENTSRFRRPMYVGGGKGESEFQSVSVAAANYFDSRAVIVVHDGIVIPDQNVNGGRKEMPSIYHTAYVVGRVAGLPPQVPVTSKSLRIDQMIHKMNETDRREALDNGVLHSFFDRDYGKIVVNMGVNSMQSNEVVIDGNIVASHLISTERIFTQLQTDIILNSKIQLLGDPNGVNRNTLTKADVITWTSGFLKSRVATRQVDNIIVSFRNITVTRQEDSYIISHEFEPNSEVNKLIFFSVIV